MTSIKADKEFLLKKITDMLYFYTQWMNHPKGVHKSPLSRAIPKAKFPALAKEILDLIITENRKESTAVTGEDSKAFLAALLKDKISQVSDKQA